MKWLSWLFSARRESKVEHDQKCFSKCLRCAFSWNILQTACKELRQNIVSGPATMSRHNYNAWRNHKYKAVTERTSNREEYFSRNVSCWFLRASSFIEVTADVTSNRLTLMNLCVSQIRDKAPEITRLRKSATA